MAKHTAARIGLLALLVLAAAAQPSADIEAVAASIQAALEGGERSDAASPRACWTSGKLTCAVTKKCTSSKCSCCGCPCANINCLFNFIKSSYLAVQKTVNALKTPANQKAAASSICALARSNASLTKTVITLYATAKCPGGTKNIKTLKAYQANYNKWCKGFSG